MELSLRAFFALLLLFSLAPAGVEAATIFSKEGGGLWNFPGTWERDHVPQEGDRVVIVEGHKVMIPLGYQTPELLSISVAEGATLTIVAHDYRLNTGAALSCNGDLYIHNGIILESDIYVGSKMYWLGGDIESRNGSRIVNRGHIRGGPIDGNFAADYQSDGENTSFVIGENGGNFKFTGASFVVSDGRFAAGRGTNVTFTTLAVTGAAEFRVEGTTFLNGGMLSIGPTADFGSGKGRLVVKAQPQRVTINGAVINQMGTINFPEMIIEKGTELYLGGLHVGPNTHLYFRDSVTAALTGLTNKGTIHLQGTTLMRRGGLVNESTLLIGGDLVRENDSPYDGPWGIQNTGRIDFTLRDSLIFGASLSNNAGGLFQVPGGTHVNVITVPTNQAGGDFEIATGGHLLITDQSRQYGTISLNGTLTVSGSGSNMLQHSAGQILGTGELHFINSALSGGGTIEPTTYIDEASDLSLSNNGQTDTPCWDFRSNLHLSGTLWYPMYGTEECVDLNRLNVQDTLFVGGKFNSRQSGFTTEPGAVFTFADAGYLTGTFTSTDIRDRDLTLAYDYPNPHQISLINGKPLTLSCPEDITLTSSPGTCGRALDFPKVEVQGSDGSATVNFDYAEDYVFPFGTTPVTVTVSQGSISGSCTFNVTVTDEEAPTLTCPGSQTVSLDPCGTYEFDPDGLGITATDNCGSATVSVNQKDFDTPGTYQIGVTATDATGNESSCTILLILEESDDPYTVDARPDNLGTVCSEQELIIRPTDLLANDGMVVEGELELLSVSANSTDGTVTANGDGTFSFVSAPDYTDDIELSYRVGVVAGSGPCTVQPASGTIYLTVEDVVANFTYEPTSSEPDALTYGFDDITEPGATEWRYTVDGTSIGTASYAQYRFPAPGTYTVCLNVTTDCGGDEVCKEVTVGGTPEPDCDQVSFGRGWSYVSFDVQPKEQPLISQVVVGSPEARSVFAVQQRREDGNIMTYLPGHPAYSTDFLLTPGAAYRVYAFDGGTFDVCGETVGGHTRIGIRAGYNWVGYTPKASRPATDYFGDIPGFFFAREQRGSLTDYAIRYHVPSLPYYSTLDMVENGVGYVVYSYAAADPGSWRFGPGGPTAGDEAARLSDVYTTYVGDVSGLAAGDTIAVKDFAGRTYAHWKVSDRGTLRAVTLFGHDTISDVFAALPPGRELYFHQGDRRATETLTFRGAGELEWLELHFPTTRIPAAAPQVELTVSPNPFRDRLYATLRLRDTEAGGQLLLHDLNGKLIRQRMLPPDVGQTYSVEWYAAGLPTGTYLLRCVVGDQTVITRRVQKF